MVTQELLGIDIGGTKTAVVLGDTAGGVRVRQPFATDADAGFSDWLERLEAQIDPLLAGGAAPAAISVSVGGPLDIEQGIVYSPPNLATWRAAPLKAELLRRFGLPVYVEHDGNAGALAEWYFGAGRGARSLVFLTMGTGLGAGLILDGSLYRGACDLAGEVGHMRIAEDGPEAYGKRGSWEGYCAGPAFGRLAQLLHPERWPQLPSTPEVARLALDGDSDAVDVVEAVGRYLGRGLAVLVDLLNPERIVIGSMAVRLGDLVLEPAREELRREALPGAVERCRVLPAALGERIGDVACLCAAIRALKSDARTGAADDDQD